MRTLIATLAACFVSFAVAEAGTIVVERSVNGDPFVPYGDPIPTNGVPVHIVIDETVPPYTGFGNDDVVFRIFDDDPGVPDDSIASITVRGAIQDGTVSLLIASGIDLLPEAIWPSAPTNELLVGVLHFGTAGQPALNFGSPDLEERSRIALAVAGNVYGHIPTGRVTRIQAPGRVVGGIRIDGVVSGNITSTQEDEYEDPEAYPPAWFRTGGSAIGRIVCNSLTGTVKAEVPEDFAPGITIYQHTASIGSIEVGEDHDGGAQNYIMSGDVLAPAGRIEVIRIGCPIKPPTTEAPKPRIWAGNGVWEIVTFKVNDLPRVVDVHAWIKTAWTAADGGAIPNAGDQRFPMPPQAQPRL